MTKPHTTLSEAIRALELPEPSIFQGTKLLPYEERTFRTKGMAENLGYTTDVKEFYSTARVRYLLGVIADMVEQHEAQEPKRQTDLSKRLRGWDINAVATIVASDLHAAADEIERYYGGMMNWKRTAEAQPTLAATQAGDAKDAARYRWFRKPGRDIVSGIDTFNEDGVQLVGISLDDAIDAAMSPTTTIGIATPKNG